MRDQHNRKINYLRLSVTDLCNLKCKYCMPEDGVEKKKHSEILSFESCVQIVESAAELGISKVRITGGEPLVRRGIIDLVKQISSVNGIDELAMTTNGLLLKTHAKALKTAGLTRVNISIDTLNPLKFRNITRGGSLQDVLDGIEAAKNNGLLPIKLNVVIINGFNTDEIESFINMAGEDIEVRFIELMPIGEASTWSEGKFISNDSIIQRYSKTLTKVIDKGTNGPAEYFKNTNTGGKVGFINPISSHFCDKCNRLRVTPDGKLKTCLHSNEEYDLRKVLDESTTKGQKRVALKALFTIGVQNKPKQHKIGDYGFAPIVRNMHRIGG